MIPTEHIRLRIFTICFSNFYAGLFLRNVPKGAWVLPHASQSVFLAIFLRNVPKGTWLLPGLKAYFCICFLSHICYLYFTQGACPSPKYSCCIYFGAGCVFFTKTPVSYFLHTQGVCPSPKMAPTLGQPSRCLPTSKARYL